MIGYRIDREPDDLRIASLEFRLQLGESAKLGRADGGEVLGMGEQDSIRVAEPLVEAQVAVCCLRLEIRRLVANS